MRYLRRQATPLLKSVRSFSSLCCLSCCLNIHSVFIISRSYKKAISCVHILLRYKQKPPHAQRWRFLLADGSGSVMPMMVVPPMVIMVVVVAMMMPSPSTLVLTHLHLVAPLAKRAIATDGTHRTHCPVESAICRRRLRADGDQGGQTQSSCKNDISHALSSFSSQIAPTHFLPLLYHNPHCPATLTRVPSDVNVTRPSMHVSSTRSANRFITPMTSACGCP